MDNLEPVVFGLLVAVAALSILSRLLRIPYPILMVLGGLVLGFVPGVPSVALDPQVVLVLFLPPLLYIGAFFTSLRDVRRDARSITLLSVGLVFATATVVAVIAHEMIGLPWAVAFTLGAIVSPTDPLAATQILSRLGAPRRIVTIIEGEGLLNDATALVLYGTAIGVAIGGTFSAADAGLKLILAPLGGIAIGVVVGWLVGQIRIRIEHPPTEITLSIFTGYAAFLPAEGLGASGVLAAVAAGVYVGWRAPEIASSETRLQGFSFWTIAQFLLNALLFVLIGLQLPEVLDELSGRSAGELILWGVTVSAAVILMRIAWVFISTTVIRAIDRRESQRARQAPWQARFVVGWAGMRGAVSLAAALAVPIETTSGAAFPGRDLILFITFCVILATLVFQGLTLPAVIRLLGVHDDGELEAEQIRARLGATSAALRRLDELENEDWTKPDTLERLRRSYGWRRQRFAARADGGDDDGYEVRSQAYQRTLRELILAQRRALVDLRNSGKISSDVMHEIEHELDLEDSRLELPPEAIGRRHREH